MADLAGESNGGSQRLDFRHRLARDPAIRLPLKNNSQIII